jgi:hypothetical protein
MSIEISEKTDQELESMVGWIVGRSHVSVSDRGIRSTVGRKLNNDIQGEDRTRVLDAAVRVHHKNQKFFTDMRF